MFAKDAVGPKKPPLRPKAENPERENGDERGWGGDPGDDRLAENVKGEADERDIKETGEGRVTRIAGHRPIESEPRHRGDCRRSKRVGSERQPRIRLAPFADAPSLSQSDQRKADEQTEENAAEDCRRRDAEKRADPDQDEAAKRGGIRERRNDWRRKRRVAVRNKIEANRDHRRSEEDTSELHSHSFIL